MSRPRSKVRKVEWRIFIPASLAGVIENEFFDPRYGKAKYGTKSDLITQLLEQYIQREAILLRKPNTNPLSEEEPASNA